MAFLTRRTIHEQTYEATTLHRDLLFALAVMLTAVATAQTKDVANNPPQAAASKTTHNGTSNAGTSKASGNTAAPAAPAATGVGMNAQDAPAGSVASAPPGMGTSSQQRPGGSASKPSGYGIGKQATPEDQASGEYCTQEVRGCESYNSGT